MVTRTWRVTDACGNTTTVTQTITIDDTTAPTVTKPDDYTLEGCDVTAITLFGYNEAETTVTLAGYLALSGAAATDNCGVTTVTYQDSRSGNCPIVVTRTWRVTDACGNTTTVTQTITIDDTTAPTFTAPADIVICRAPDCSYNALPAVTGDVTDEADNCSTGINATYLDDAITWLTDCDHAGYILRTWTLTDNCGNTTSKDQKIWIEPVPRLTLIPAQDTICDGGTTNIEIQSPTVPILPVRFDYQVVIDNPDSLHVTTTGSGTGLLNGAFILENFDNVSVSAQRAVITVTPYTVTPLGILRCSGIQSTAVIWVEPTPTMYFVPAQDTICDNDITDIEMRSITVPTLPVMFDYTVVAAYPDSVTITNTQADRTGYLAGQKILEQLNNLSNRKQLVTFTVTPYTVTDKGTIRCTGTPNTIDVWVEPTPTMYFVPAQDTICDNDITDIEMRSITVPTLPVMFDYTVVAAYPDSVTITNTQADRTGYLAGQKILEQLNNLSNRKQLVTFTVTPYTVTDKGTIRCTGTPNTIDVWVEPTPTMYFVPAQDTICDNDITDIEMRSITVPTLPVMFDYTVVAAYPDSVTITNTQADRTGYLAGQKILEQLNNLSNRKQLVTFTVTPYTVTDKGTIRCTGTPNTIDVWVEPTALVFGVITNDTICNTNSITYTLTSTTEPTVGLRFNVSVVNPYTEITGFTASRPNLTGPGPLNFTETLNNSGDTARMIMYVIAPATVNNLGVQNCPGINDTIRLWINPTPRATPINAVPEMCYGQTINLTLNSPTVMTKGVIRFDYTTTVSDPGILGTLPADNDQPQGQQFTYSYQNNTDTINSVYYHIIPDNILCGNGPLSTQEIKVHPHPLQSMSPTALFTCSGGSDGTLTAILSRGSKDDIILWDRPSFLGDTTYVTNSNVDNLTIRYTGQYYVTVTDAFGCHNTSQTESVIGVVFQTYLTVMDYPTGYGTQCSGESNGTLSFYEDMGSTGIPPYNYWLVYNNIDTVSTGIIPAKETYVYVGSLPAGHYSLHIRDANGCLNSFAYPQTIMSEPDPITVQFESTKYAGNFDISCRGYNDGHVWVSSKTGGNPGPFSYQWYDSGWNLLGTTDRLDNISAGRYYLMTTDVFCTKLDSVELKQGPGMELSEYNLHHTSDNAYGISCHGGSDGSIDITVTGGSGNYSYLWTDGASYTASTPDISGLKEGTYTVQVTDENGCILKLLPGSLLPSFTLNEPDTISILPVLSSSSFGLYNINCNGDNNGSIGITVTGGSGSGTYIYNWTTTDGSGLIPDAEDQNTLTAGAYTVAVTDLYGCRVEFDTMLTEPAPLASAIIPKHITCATPGLDNGEADLTVAGGVAPYTYLWSNGATSDDITGLTAGEYIVTITDANACQLTDTVTINLPPDLEIAYSLSNHNGNGFNISCFNYNDGAINLTTTNSVAPFIFSWTGPSGFTSASDTISGLRAGQYNLHIIDANLCTIDTMFTLTEPGELSFTFDPSHSLAGGFNINCAGDSTGSLNVIPVNAVGAVSYLWSDGVTLQMRDNLPEGMFSVYISDSNGCFAIDSTTLTQPDSLKLTFSVTQPWCSDKPDGEIRLTVSGGVIGTDYNYRWSDNSTSRDLTDIQSGSYSVRVTDLNGCVIKDSVLLKPQREICLIIPNAISPNGDNINDIWNIGETDLYPDLEIKIFDRYGILVWKSEKGYPQKWDGTSRGRKLTMDSYHYIIDLHNGTKPLIGNITIVR